MKSPTARGRARDEHGRITDVAVIGLPDPDTGERACAVLCPADTASPISLQEIGSYLREKGLTTQKIPEQLEIVDAIPRNATGKILKHELRKKFENTSRPARA